ncbi:MAG: 2-isopropylmalate synthase [Betaproteobacteria bacterium]
MRKVLIFDTTLRDGEQTPGVSLNVAEKVEIARQLARLGVDVIEAGFPVASPGDFAAVQAVAREVKGPVVCGLARAVPGDIERAWEALREAARTPRIHTFIATSPIHLQYKLKKTPDEVLAMAVEAVKFARRFTPDVEFSAEDATRSDPAFLARVFAAVIEAGATTINVPDTVGYTTPQEMTELLEYLKENVPGLDRVTLSVHCHDDLGLAVANSMAAVAAGAGQVECTVNGLGERAGNAALEEVVMGLRTRSQFYQASTGIVTELIYRTSRLVSTLTGVAVPPNKAVIGANAFAHESGIHQDGVLKARQTYEIMTPESVGFTQSRLVLGKLSGRHALRARLKELGYTLTAAEFAKAYARFLEVADRKKEVSDQDLEALIEGEVLAAPEIYQLDYLHVASGNTTVPTATVRLTRDGAAYEEAACGDGPVDAAYRAVDRITGLSVNLMEYNLRAVTGGKDALGEVLVKVKDNGHRFVGRGTSTDIIEASVRAYLQAINKVVAAREREAASGAANGSTLDEEETTGP